MVSAVPRSRSSFPSRTSLSAPVPGFPPVRAGRGSRRSRRRGAPAPRRRVLSAGLAVCAAGIAVAVPDSGTARESEPRRADGRGPASERSVTPQPSDPAAVSAPVRISDAATVRLLSPGDRIDVLASESKNASARMVARSVRVVQVPKSSDTVTGDEADGALIVVAVTRRTATALAGAAAESRLAVTLC
ncbi:RcpC/CpaB family pilus assembly protein [Streptomyces sp. NBC_01775]|uniref:RcpC/CpaB family pilus assembly protein n=1 Tax=Streptomyces sp. NBC_01775 TaxID=2975939 RepID=UPI002DD94047|nr:RcpC/CpaB family pilus assembly protein [Streptomyces sp. NBC_01775]